MTRLLLLAGLGALLATAPAAADQPIVKRIRTSKAQVVEHIRQSSQLHGGDDSTPDDVTHIECTGYHFNKARKAKTWRCTYSFTYPGDSTVCRGAYHGGYVRFRIADGRLGTGWRDEATKDCGA